MGASPAETRGLMDVLRPLTDKPLIVKLTPNTDDPAAVAIAAEEGGADAVSLINTLRARAFDPAGGGDVLGGGSGGLSGPAVRAIALDQVARVGTATGIPVIGMGGIETGADALAFLDAGARVVAVGTASFRDPLAAVRVRQELAEALQSRPNLDAETLSGTADLSTSS
jgi:dihydroorotate dehydrogenase (NAD+) catalytic subunit